MNGLQFRLPFRPKKIAEYAMEKLNEFVQNGKSICRSLVLQNIIGIVTTQAETSVFPTYRIEFSVVAPRSIIFRAFVTETVNGYWMTIILGTWLLWARDYCKTNITVPAGTMISTLQNILSNQKKSPWSPQYKFQKSDDVEWLWKYLYRRFGYYITVSQVSWQVGCLCKK